MKKVPLVLGGIAGWIQEFLLSNLDRFWKRDNDKMKYDLYSHHTKF